MGAVEYDRRRLTSGKIFSNCSSLAICGKKVTSLDNFKYEVQNWCRTGAAPVLARSSTYTLWTQQSNFTY